MVLLYHDIMTKAIPFFGLRKVSSPRGRVCLSFRNLTGGGSGGRWVLASPSLADGPAVDPEKRTGGAGPERIGEDRGRERIPEAVGEGRGSRGAGPERKSGGLYRWGRGEGRKSRGRG